MSLQRELLKLPNILSIARICSAPVFVVLLLKPGERLSIIAAILFLIVCATDWLDGYLARRLNIVTAVGKFLDPLADKVLIVTSLVMLITLDRAPAWMVALIVAREVAVTGLRTVAAERGVAIAASNLGKAKTVLQIIAVAFLLLHYPFFNVDFHAIGMMVFWFALAVTVYSGIDYFVKFLRNLPAA